MENMVNKLLTMMLAGIIVLSSALPAAAASRTYTTNDDFDEGTLVGVEHDTVPDQLQLTTAATTLPFLWVPNQVGTISKIDTLTGNELGRYWVSPNTNSQPSRTTVDLQGNVWVGVRQAGTVVKVGLDEGGNCIERNGIPGIQTSRDSSNDGVISGAEILPWGQDECVLHEVLLTGTGQTYTPGTPHGGYDYDYWGVAPRGLAIDSNNDLWAGTWSTSNYFKIDGDTGAILNTIPVPGHNAYGAVIDRNGILWSAGPAQNHLLKINTNTNAVLGALGMGYYVYGLGLDNINHLFVSGWTSGKLARVNIITGAKELQIIDGDQGRGVAVTNDNDVWIANSGPNLVSRYNNDLTILKASIPSNYPTGVAVDDANKVWVIELGSEYVRRIDPGTNSVELSKNIPGSGGHYGYSDMTGLMVRSVTTRIGTWTVNYDSNTAGEAWGTVSWNDLVPQGTSVTVRARSSEDASTWSAWEDATNGGALSSTPPGRYLQVEATLQSPSGQSSPILYDLTVQSKDGTEIPEFPTIALPILSVIGLMALMYNRRREN